MSILHPNTSELEKLSYAEKYMQTEEQRQKIIDLTVQAYTYANSGAPARSYIEYQYKSGHLSAAQVTEYAEMMYSFVHEYKTPMKDAPSATNCRTTRCIWSTWSRLKTSGQPGSAMSGTTRRRPIRTRCSVQNDLPMNRTANAPLQRTARGHVVFLLSNAAGEGSIIPSSRSPRCSGQTSPCFPSGTRRQAIPNTRQHTYAAYCRK